MITNKDIRVENGNIVINGDKYPLDGQSPATIMEIVSENSDTTPTESSIKPITSGGVYTAIDTINDTIGDITQTGVTGADVAAQLGVLNTAVGSKINNGTFIEGNSEITITSARRYDTLIVVGGFGSTVVFDVIFVNDTVGAAKLASQGSTVTSVDSYSFKYKAQNEYFQGRIFSINNAQISIA